MDILHDDFCNTATIKDNQVECFKEYLQFYQEQKEEEEEENTKAQEKALLEVVEIIKKYNIQSTDLSVLATNYNILNKIN